MPAIAEPAAQHNTATGTPAREATPPTTLFETSNGAVCTSDSTDCRRVRWLRGLLTANNGARCAVNRPTPIPCTSAHGYHPAASPAMPAAATIDPIAAVTAGDPIAPRRATTSVTASAPIAVIPASRPAVPGPSPYERTSNGRHSDAIGKALAAISATATSIVRSAGVMPRPRVVRVGGASKGGRINASTSADTAKVTASARAAPRKPTQPTRTPPTGPPTSDTSWFDEPRNAIARGSRSSSTNIRGNAPAHGSTNASTDPIAKAVAMSNDTPGCPAVSTSVVAHNRRWPASSTRRGPNRSPAAPPTSNSTVLGSTTMVSTRPAVPGPSPAATQPSAKYSAASPSDDSDADASQP